MITTTGGPRLDKGDELVADRERARGTSRPGQALVDQIPESGFPAGVGTPSAVALVALLLLAALSSVLLKVRDPGSSPAAIIESQQQLAVGVGRSAGTSVGQNVADLRTITAIAQPPAELLATLGANGKWRGLAVLDARTRSLLAARGEPVPAQLLPAGLGTPSITPVPDVDGRLVLLTALPLPDNRVLVALSRTRLPDVGIDADPDHAVLLTDATGRVLDSRGTLPAQDDRTTRDLVSLAAAAGAGGEEGNLLGTPADGRQTVVTYAPVTTTGVEGDLGLAVVAFTRTAVVAGAGDDQALLPAGALVVLALLGFLLIRAVLVRPVHRLRANALAVAGGKLGARVAFPPAREVRRVALAIEHCRATLRGVEPQRPKTRTGLPAVVAVSLAAAAVLGWSATLVLTVGTGTAEVPGAVVTSVRNQTVAVSTALRRSVNDGVADLRAVTALGAGRDAAALKPALEQLMAGQARYRSAYVVDPAGQPSGVVGRPPLRAPEPVPAAAGLSQRNDSGPIPVLVAHAPLPGGSSLVGEFDMVQLTALLDRAPGAVRVLNAGMRTIAATEGYLAFEEVTDPRLRTAAEAARAGAPVSELRDTGLVISTQVRGGASTALDWVVVADQPVSELALTTSELRRNVLTVALIGALIALLLFGWHFLVLVRPLNRVAATADAIVGGSRGEVVYPQRQDQIGTVASCLEICRQALADGTGRLGEVRRPRGAATDATELFSAVADGVDLPRPRSRQRV